MIDYFQRIASPGQLSERIIIGDFGIECYRIRGHIPGNAFYEYRSVVITYTGRMYNCILRSNLQVRLDHQFQGYNTIASKS